jgi:hypothetical protein
MTSGSTGVVTNAHRINAGQPPITHGLADFFRPGGSVCLNMT